MEIGQYCMAKRDGNFAPEDRPVQIVSIDGNVANCCYHDGHKVYFKIYLDDLIPLADEKGHRKNEIKKWKNLLKEIERDDLAATMGSRVYHYPEEARVYVINKIKGLKEKGRE